MQSTKLNQDLPSIYSKSLASSKAPSVEVSSESKGIERSFAIACGLGAVTVIFGVTALIYQFAPEFNKLRNASSQVEVSKFSTFQG